MIEVYTVVREASDGARWEGVAELVDGRVVEKGAWVMTDGKRSEGTVEMQWGLMRNQEPGSQEPGREVDREEDVLKVVTAFGAHEYLLVASEDGWVGQYECGDDMYYVQTQRWGGDGWTMRFEVEGAKKDGWQEVRYKKLEVRS